MVVTEGANEERQRVSETFWTNLPPHEDVIAAVQRFIVKVIRVEAFGILVKRFKFTL